MSSAPNPIVNAFLDDDGSRILVFEKTPEGEVRERRIRASYVTYHRASELDDRMMRSLKGSDHVAHIAHEGEGNAWVRIGWKNDALRRTARFKFRDMGVECFEGDVDPVMFWLVQNRARIAKPRRVYLDFEADSRVPLSRKEDMRVLSWSLTAHDANEEGTHETLVRVLEEDTEEAEADLLEKLVANLRRFDQVCTWEGDWKGGEFDSVLFAARTRRCGLGVDPRRWMWLNQLAVWRKMNMHSAESGAEKESFKLEDIAWEQIGKGKESVPDFVVKRFGDAALRGLGGLTWDLWEAGGKFRELLVRYNARDTEILRELEKKKGYITLFQATCEICGIPPVTRSLQPTRQMDGYLLRLGRERNHRFPTKAFREDDEEEDKGKFKGAVVFSPKSVPVEDEGWTKEHAAAWRREHGFRNGILRDVHVCDFKSLYPSVMRTWNLSGDAVAGMMSKREVQAKGIPAGHCWSPGNGLLTRVEPEVVLPLALRDLMNERQKYSDEAARLPPGTPEWQDAMSKSTACKVTANSFYGGGGSSYSRFNNRDVSEACTQNGVHFLKLTAEEGEKRKMLLVYGDTDSNFVIGPTEDGFRKFVSWINKKRIPEEVARHGCKENFVELAFEKTFSRIVFVRAKAYVGRYSQYKGTRAKPDSEPEVKGVAYKRGDKGKLARELQGRVIDLLVGGLRVKDATGKKVPANLGLRVGKCAEGNPAVVGEEEPGRAVETPTDDLDVYRAVLRAARDHVLTDPLPLEEVRFSKSINKKLKEYVKTTSTGKESVPAHITAAKALEARGEIIGAGSRVEYVVVDGSESPQKVIPASDYAGECDRFYLWERVFEPSKSLLEAAFPDENWEEWGDVRPKKPRGKAAKVPEEQLGLALTSTRVDAGELAMPSFSTKPLLVEIPESAGEPALERQKEVFTRHPGARAVELHIVLKTGARAVLSCPLRVSTGPRFREDVERAISGEGEGEAA
jgi:DNA polymerase elongation subunit (family B)